MTKQERIEAEAKAGWGRFRKWIAKNPLTGFWTGFAMGGALFSALIAKL